MNRKELSGLSNEITYRRFLIEQGKVQKILTRVNVKEYVVLYQISKYSKDESLGGRIYIHELMEYVKLSMSELSTIMESLTERGLILWTHEGDGRDGTYAVITEDGSRLIDSQHEKLKLYYSRVIEKMGEEKFHETLKLMKELESAMDSAFEEMEK